MNAETMGQGLPAAAIEMLTARFRVVPDLVAVFLHGSALRGAMRPDSDLDVACLFSGKAPLPGAVLSLAAAWGAGLPYPLDVGVLSSTNLVYAYQALMNGRCIYCRDVPARDRRVAELMGLWAQFNRDREEVRHAYAVAG